MAVRKRVPANSSIDARTSANHPASATSAPTAEQTLAERKSFAAFHDLEAAVPGRNLYLLRAGAALLAGFELLYFIVDYFVPPPLTLGVSALHAAAVG